MPSFRKIFLDVYSTFVSSFLCGLGPPRLRSQRKVDGLIHYTLHLNDFRHFSFIPILLGGIHNIFTIFFHSLTCIYIALSDRAIISIKEGVCLFMSSR